MPQTPETTPDTIPQADTTPRPVMHTFQSDLALAMDTTEAGAVQELLKTARDKESDELEKVVVHHQRKWYTTGGIILIVLALAAIVYGVYYYRHLTVGVTTTPSVGVFQNSTPVSIDQGDIGTTITRLTADTTLPEGKPVLVPLVRDTTTLVPLDTEAALSYMGIHPGEPFLATISLARLGLMNVGTSVAPFLIFFTPTPELATKEFLIAEPKLLEMTSGVLMLNQHTTTQDIGTSFVSSYMYNLPVRTLTSTDVDTREKTILLYYGYATDNTIVLASNPTVLKAVYDTIIRQR